MGSLMLSIYVPVYNHEKYITKALDSILMQETEYSYEVLVGEDASTDNSKAVLEKYEIDHPGRIQVFYRPHNMSREPIGNGMDLRLRGKGKYCIMLEGDDYWIDKHKIQKQIEFLENNPEYIAVGHDCVIVDAESNTINEVYPFSLRKNYHFRHFSVGLLPGQTATLMTKNWVKDKLFDTYLIDKRVSPNDRAMVFSYVCNGKVYCMQEKMSAYRHVRHGGSSYSANVINDPKGNMIYLKELINYSNRINNKSAIFFSKFMMLLELRSQISKGIIEKERVKQIRSEIGGIVKYIPWLVYRDCKYLVAKVEHMCRGLIPFHVNMWIGWDK